VPTRSVSASRLAALLGPATERSPAYLGLADGLRLLIADGRIPPGTRLPSERELTGTLDVSRTTVTRAYAVLRDRGYLSSRRGSGSEAALPYRQRREVAAGLNPGLDTAGSIDLTCAAMPAPAGLAAAYREAVEELPCYTAGAGYHPLGLPDLREAIAARYRDRGLATTADEVMVTSGALAAIALAGRALLGPGDRVLMESPTYPNAIATLRQTGARPVSLPLDPTGWDDEALAAAVRQTTPRAALLIPDFHNPTGALMPSAQRETIAGVLGRARTVPVIDETLAELALDTAGPMPEPFAAHLPRSVTVGSASKTFWGGLRIGWVRAPAGLMPALLQQRLMLDLGAPVVEQLALLRLLAGREALVAERRASLVASRDALVGALSARLPEWHVAVPRGGLSLWCQLPQALSTAVTVAAEAEGLVLASGPQFAVEGGLERWLRLPFTHPPEVLVDAVDRLARAWESATAGRAARRRSVRRRTPLVA
jgi:DNA-binding transcriptional MocR family regulator